MLLYGNQAVLPIPDIERTDYLVIMGANPVVEEAATAQPTTHALFNAHSDGGDVGARGCAAFAKHDGAVVCAREDPVGDDDVEVDKVALLARPTW